MGMSTHVIGFKPPDAKWRQMKKAYDSCHAAGVEPPKEVSAFFEWGAPDEAGVEVNIEAHECCTEYNEEMVDGFEIDVTKLPKDVTRIRFWNSY